MEQFRRVGSVADRAIEVVHPERDPAPALFSHREAVETRYGVRRMAWQVEQAMQERGLTKAAMAHEMHTSRAALNRLLDPENTSVTLHTLQRAAAVVGKRVQITLEDAQP